MIDEITMTIGERLIAELRERRLQHSDVSFSFYRDLGDIDSVSRLGEFLSAHGFGRVNPSDDVASVADQMMARLREQDFQSMPDGRCVIGGGLLIVAGAVMGAQGWAAFLIVGLGVAVMLWLGLFRSMLAR